MCSMYASINVSPQQIDGSKIVTIKDNKNNQEKIVKVSAQKADEFVALRNEVTSTLAKRRKNSLIYMPLGCGAISALCSLFNKEWIKQFGKIKTAGIQGLLGCASGLALAAILESKKSHQRAMEKFDNTFITANS